MFCNRGIFVVVVFFRFLYVVVDEFYVFIGSECGK